MQEPLAIIDAVAVVAIDPYRFAARALGNEIIATHVGAIPPARFDSLRAIAQHPWPQLERVADGLRLREQPHRARIEESRVRHYLSRTTSRCAGTARKVVSDPTFPSALGTMLGVRHHPHYRVFAKTRTQTI